MSAVWRNRRKPKVIGNDDDNDDEKDTGPVVKRPKISKSKPRPIISQFDDEISAGGSESEVLITKKRGLARKILDPHASVRVGQDQDGPSYTSEHLKELEESTLSTPKPAPEVSTRTDKDDDMTIVKVEDGDTDMLDVASNFGELAQLTAPSIIPSEAEIREKKARRARLASEQQSKEDDYISLNRVAGEYNDNDEWDLVVRAETAHGGRLIRDDEDFAEGFDEFVQDGTVAIGKKAEREQTKKERQSMRELIEEQDVDGVDSDFEEKAAYDAAQTRAGRYNEAPSVVKKAAEELPPLLDIQTYADWLKSTRVKEIQDQNNQTDLRRKKRELEKEDSENTSAIPEIVDRMNDTQVQFTRLFQNHRLSCQTVLRDHAGRHPGRFSAQLLTSLRMASKGFTDVSRQNSVFSDGEEPPHALTMAHSSEELSTDDDEPN